MLVPKDKAEVKLRHKGKKLSKKEVDVFTKIGGGIAAKVHQAAETMTAEEYDALLTLAKRLDSL